MAVRKIHHRTNNNVSYLMSSPKMNRQIHCESRLEHSLALMLEMAPHVISFEEQPRKFKVCMNGLSFSTTPDFMVTLKTGDIEFVEVKYWNEAQKKADRLKATTDQLSSESFVYKVKTEKEIRRCQQVLHNCQFLKSFKQRSFNERHELEAMAPCEPIRFQDLVERLGSRNTVVEMIAHQLVYCDFYQAITSDTVLRPLLEGDFDYLYL